jgi:hypothetical protein
VLSDQHIRFATNQQLATLFETDKNTVSRWTNQRHGISGRSLERATQKGIALPALIQGLEQRQEDAELAKIFQTELDAFLSRQPVVA